jgi:tetratricopeptide (TPR) repeat protein
MSMGNPREATAYLERAVAMWESTLGASHPVYAQGLGNLAYLYSTIGRTAEAESLWTRALALAEKTLGPQHPTYGALLSGYADSLQHTGRKAEANRIRHLAQSILPAPSAVVDYRDLAHRK